MEALEKPRQRKKRKFERRPTERIRRIEITERVDRILLLLFEYRLLTTTQIAELLFIEGYGKQGTGRLVSSLYDHRLVDKPEEQVRIRERLGRGSRPDVLALGDRGAEHLEERYGIERAASSFRAKNRTVKNPYIEHTLLTSEVMLAFERSVARRDDVRLIYPREILAAAPQATRTARRPFEWQVKAKWEGTELRIPVTPDFKVFGLEFLSVPAPGNRAYFMLEADTGTETVIPETLKQLRKPTLFHKYLGYYTTFRARYHEERFGVVKAFRLLSVTARSGVQVSRDPRTGARVERTRMQSMQEAARLASGGENPHFFLFADLATFKAHDDVLTMPWATARPGKTAILDLKR